MRLESVEENNKELMRSLLESEEQLATLRTGFICLDKKHAEMQEQNKARQRELQESLLVAQAKIQELRVVEDENLFLRSTAGSDIIAFASKVQVLQRELEQAIGVASQVSFQSTCLQTTTKELESQQAASRAALAAAIEQMIDAQRVMQDRISLFCQTLTEAEEKTSTLRGEKEEAKQREEDVVHRMHELEAGMSEMQAKFLLMRGAAQRVFQQTTDLQAEWEDQVSQFSQVSQDLTAAEQLILSLQHENRITHQELAHARETIAHSQELEAKIVVLEADCLRLKSSKASADSNFASKVQELQEELEKTAGLTEKTAGLANRAAGQSGSVHTFSIEHEIEYSCRMSNRRPPSESPPDSPQSATRAAPDSPQSASRAALVKTIEHMIDAQRTLQDKISFIGHDVVLGAQQLLDLCAELSNVISELFNALEAQSRHDKRVKRALFIESGAGAIVARRGGTDVLLLLQKLRSELDASMNAQTQQRSLNNSREIELEQLRQQSGSLCEQLQMLHGSTSPFNRVVRPSDMGSPTSRVN
jgi:hypothetical protein